MGDHDVALKKTKKDISNLSECFVSLHAEMRNNKF